MNTSTMNKYIAYFFCVFLFCSCSEFYSNDSSDSYSESGTGTGGSMARFTVKGNYLYVIDSEYLQTYDISDSSNLNLKSRISIGGIMETIFPSEGLLFMGSTSGMYVYSLDDPAKPEYVSNYQHFTSCDPVIVNGKYAYVTLRSDQDNWSCSRNLNELQVIDISDIYNPFEAAAYTMINPKGLAMTGSTLFVCDGLDLVMMDASDPLKMRELKRYEMDGTPYDVIARDSILTVSYSEGLMQYSYNNDTIQMLSVVY